MISISCENQRRPIAISQPNSEIDPELKVLTSNILKDTSIAEPYYYRASAYFEKGQYEAAIRDLNKCISLDSSRFEYYHLLSDCYLDYYKSGEALDIMEETVLKFPSSIPSLLKLSELQLILKQYDQSFFTIQKVLNIDHQNAEAFFMMGMIYRAQGDSERAINSFQSAVEIDPEIVDAWIILGDLFSEKDFKIAERYYDNAIRLDPENIQAYHSKAFHLQNKDKIQEAISIYKVINSKDPQYADAYLNTGILYLEQDSLTLAHEHFNILCKIEPQNHLGYYYRGITKMFQGKTEEAKQDLEQALVFNSQFEKAIIALEQINTLEQ